MKNEKNKETRAKSPDRLILKLATGNPFLSGRWIQFQPSGTRPPFLWRVYPSDRAEAFVSLPGKGSGFTIGKGPPGLSPRPGGGAVRNPDNKAGPPKGRYHSKNTLQLNNTVLSIHKKQQTNFLQILILKIMKKQILILVLFVMATFAGVNNSYGQCTGAPLTPAVGIDYPYGVTVSGAVGSAATYSWFVTQNTDLLAGELAPLAPGDAFFTIESGGGTNELHLKWLPKAIAGTFYVVVKYTATSAALCPIENMKVFEVKPINTFLLAITGSTATGGVAQIANCAPEITAAVINTPAAPTVQYTYGTSTIYYEVTATGILGAWKPSIRIPALGATQAYVSAEWSSNAGGAWAACTGFTAGGTTQDLGLAADATVTDAVAGSKYVIKLVIDNHSFETLADQVLPVAIDGFLPTAYTVSDIQGAPSLTPCDPALAFAKTANYTISARPTVDATLPATPLIVKAP